MKVKAEQCLQNPEGKGLLYPKFLSQAHNSKQRVHTGFSKYVRPQKHLLSFHVFKKIEEGWKVSKEVKQSYLRLGVMVHTCNLSTLYLEGGGP
jgi:hypothetical protein